MFSYVANKNYIDHSTTIMNETSWRCLL